MAAFKVSKSTSKILKNFAGISNSILLTEGQTQKTIQSSKSVLAVAELPEAWPHETGIFNLNMFLGVLSLFESPEIAFGDDSMTISQGKSRIKYRYSDPSTILVPPSKTLPNSNPSVEFTLGDALVQLNKSCSMLELPSIRIRVTAGDVTVEASDAKNPASHTFAYDVPSEEVTLHDASFSTDITFKQEHLAMLLDGNYRVALANWKYGYFVHQSEPVSYYIVAQA